ncbi:HAD-IIB family hydrolase [Candidatus Clavichlamydia salmonicola]|uniref:HAD-IIB family hydrolase n=1 Tax=Candidatus Clavichlamydia salmonicola TaxID=469812 RepID=UPI001890CB66|nr:HAD family hydrolase [Candidatus Clavichlamydia salmonicola]
MSKGLIVLDLDGTVTNKPYGVPAEVSDQLEAYVNDGWLVTIATGRCFGFARFLAKGFPNPLFVGLQNGAAVIRFPDQEILIRNYITSADVKLIAHLANKHKVGFAIEAGVERNDAYYYVHASPVDEVEAAMFYDRSIHYFKSESKEFLVHYLINFDDYPFLDCAMITFSLPLEKAKPLYDEIEKMNKFNVSLIVDAWRKGHYLLHINNKKAGKGSVIDLLKGHEFVAKHNHFVIVGGDDTNDIPMLKKGDFKIVMNTAPLHMLELADFIAPAAAEMGIILGLQKGADAYRKIFKN